MEQRSQTKEESIIEERGKGGSVLNKYLKGRYLGKGGFAKCYEFTNLATGKKYAAKIIEKATLTRSKAKEKLASEIEIHKSIRSEFVVKYQRSFEDAANVYIILELCPNQTLNQLIKRRKRITELEARYYLRQISLAIKDFQQQMVIHRDLKLGNLLLTDNLEIRISDFGLAAKLTHPGQRRKTMCGTPNYIAPQILQNNTSVGHSYEVDIWSLGVIAYACLVGRPPFETNDVKTTYNRIKMCNYSFPDHISLATSTKHFISKMLQKDPRHRLSIEEVLADEFFSLPVPDALPTTLLACPPNAHFMAKYQQPPPLMQLQLKHRESTQTMATQKTQRVLQKGGDSTKCLMRTNSIQQLAKPSYGHRAASTTTLARGRMLSSKMEMPTKTQPKPTPPPIQQPPFAWVTFFQENSKFGTAYMLNSNAIGMKFNDSTGMVGSHTFQKIRYMQLGGQESQVFQASVVPERLAKKFKIITYYLKQLRSKKELYENGLNNEQIIEKEKHRLRETPENAMTVWVTKLYKTSKAHFFWFNNRDYQVIFQDNTELLFSKDAVTYVNKLGQRVYFNRATLDSQPQQIKKRANYAANSLQTLRENSRGGANKENNMVRSSSVVKMEKQPAMLKGSASTSRIPPPRVLKY